jgi:methylenetetrahydrofolate dehydrogenase (NADP+)/methenyltetrahydrofolate cyclohydrolase
MIIDGKKVALDLEVRIKEKVDALSAQAKRVPHLAVVLVGDNPASQVYVKHKVKACARVGFQSSVLTIDKDVSQENLMQQLEQLNNDKGIDGILVQLPLPSHLDTNAVIESLDPTKDVDGLHSVNVAKLYSAKQGFIPCTPKGVMSLFKAYHIDLQGKHAVVIGRSALVGRPVAQLLLNENATVTICHSKTKDMPELVKTADIVVVAIGKPAFLTLDYTHPQQVIIDVGINRVDNHLVGDVDYESIKDDVLAITPVPGGVGPMTIVSLLENTLDAYVLKESSV